MSRSSRHPLANRSNPNPPRLAALLRTLFSTESFGAEAFLEKPARMCDRRMAHQPPLEESLVTYNCVDRSNHF